MKTLVIKRDDRQYQCEVCQGDFYGEATVIVKEIVHPERVFRKTELIGYTKIINLDDYDTILEGVEEAVDKYHAEKTKEDRIKKMWKEFEEKA